MNSLVRILPEVLLTLTGVVIMLVEPLLPKSASRKSMGWLAVLGTLFALVTSLAQFNVPSGTAYFGLVQTDAFSAFFHVTIASIVLVSLLVTFDAVLDTTENLGELLR